MIPDLFARGQVAIYSVTYRTTDGETLITPGNLVVTVEKPDGNIDSFTLGVDPELAVVSTGTVTLVYEITETAAFGYYRIRFKATDGALSAGVQHSKTFLFEVATEQ